MKKVNWIRISQTLTILTLFLMGTFGFLYWLTGQASFTILRWWAWSATAALPLASGLAWYYGRSTAQAQMKGVQWGVNQVMGAAHQTADLRATGVSKVRQVVRESAAPSSGVTIIQPVIAPKSLPKSNDVNGVIEL